MGVRLVAVLVAVSVVVLVLAQGPRWPARSSITVANDLYTVREAIPSKEAPGYFLVTPLDGDAAYWLDRAGRVRHVLELPGDTLVVKQDGEGVLTISYGLPRDYGPDGANRISSRRALANIRKTLHCSPDAANPAHLHHDITRSSRGTYFLIVACGLNKIVWDDVLVEINRAGDVTWHLSLLNAMYDDPTDVPSVRGEHWLHTNSLQQMPDGNLLVSLRDVDTIVEIGYPSGKLLRSYRSDGLSQQHSAFLTPSGNINVFDNGYESKRSAAVLLSRTGKVLGRHELGFYSSIYGSAERLPDGNWLVADGTHGRVLEYDTQWKPVFELDWQGKNWVTFLHGMRSQFYRVQKVNRIPFN